MEKTEEERDEEMSEWVVIQTSPNSPTIDAINPQNSPMLQPSHRRENPPDGDDDKDSVVPVDGEKEHESSSTANLSLPWRVIETAKKLLIKDLGFFTRTVERIRRNRRRVFLSFTLFLVSSLVYVKLVRWWRQLQEEKLRFLLRLREKDKKIKELMLEIGRLKELLSSRSRVRVIRIS